MSFRCLFGGRWLETNVSEPFASNGCFSGSTILALSKYIFSLWLYNPCGSWSLFQFLNPYTVGRTPWMGDQTVARPLHTHRTTQTKSKYTPTNMSRVGFEPTIPVFKRAKTVHTLDRAATVASLSKYTTL
jgi:hypothetical protein